MKISLSAKIAIVYFLISNLWRFTSDKAILSLFEINSASDLLKFQTYRSLLFTIITSVLVYFIFNYFFSKLAKSKRQYQQLFEVNPNPMWVYNLKTLKFIAVNEAAIESYGYSQKEFDSMTIRDIRPPEDIDKLKQAIANRAPGFYSSGVWRHKKKNGQLIYVKISSHPIHFQNQDAELILSLDVTKQIEHEKQLLDLNSNLEKKVQERTRQLQGSVEGMETLNEELRATNEELTSSNEALLRLTKPFEHKRVLSIYKVKKNCKI